MRSRCSDKRRADAIGSNAGQCLWTGIISPARARAVADRLLGPELFSGWGIRTYASGQPGYNPIGYHTGTVWPHDTSIAAAGLRRYGLHQGPRLGILLGLGGAELFIDEAEERIEICGLGKLLDERPVIAQLLAQLD